jgi:CelD/BcsL family acetyltransferase involved in cellulose biosynthesis
MATALQNQLELQIRLISDERQLADLTDVWNSLPGPVPFRQHEWLSTWWRHFRGPGDELFVPVLYDAGGETVGLAPCYVACDRWLGRVVRFLGSGKVCSEYLTVLAVAGTEDDVASRLADWLANDAAAYWDVLDFDGIDPHDRPLELLVGKLAELGHPTLSRHRGRIWRVPLAATWDEFVGRLSKGRRAKVRAFERRLANDSSIVLRNADDLATLHEGLDIFRRLHLARRASLGDDGCWSLAGFDRFLEEAAVQFQQLGQLRLQWIEVAGEPAAIEFDLLGDDTLFYYQTGMNPALAEMSPGWLLQVASIKRAIDEGLSYFDFLRGDEAYKTSWGAEPRQLVQYRVAAKRPLAFARFQLWRSAMSFKNRLIPC